MVGHSSLEAGIGVRVPAPQQVFSIKKHLWDNQGMKDLIIIVLVIILGFIVYPKLIQSKLKNKIKEMESELQKRKQQ